MGDASGGAAVGREVDDKSVELFLGKLLRWGVSLAALGEASTFIASKIDHRLPSRYAQAMQGSKVLRF